MPLPVRDSLTLFVPVELLDDDVLCAAHLYDARRITELESLAAAHFLDQKRTLVGDEDVHLEHGREVDHVERGTPPNRIVHHVAVHVEFCFELGSQRFDECPRQLDDDVEVLRRSGNAM
ncbi:MAG: hypothetical protein U0263_41890 [Polyangiaceae bacterium]